MGEYINDSIIHGTFVIGNFPGTIQIIFLTGKPDENKKTHVHQNLADMGSIFRIGCGGWI